MLLNFIHVGRLDIFDSLAPWAFVVPEQVSKEVEQDEQARLLEAAVERGSLRPETITDPRELSRYAELIHRVGKGEAACLAIAVERGWTLVSDDGRFLRIARELLGENRLVNTPGLLLLAIRRKVISVEEADRIKTDLETNRFRMRFRSFRDVLRRR